MKVYQYPALKDNYNWIVICEYTNQCAGVDIYDAKTFIDYVENHNLNPVAILNTHHHNDHTGGNLEIKKQYPDIAFYGSEYDMKNNRIDCQTNSLNEGDVVDIGDIKFSILDIPGHTLGHIAYYNDEAAFVGDTLFALGCGRIFEGNPEMMYHSLEKIVKTINLDTPIYCGHEYTLANLNFSYDLNNDYFKSYREKIKDLRENNKMTVPTDLTTELIFNPFLMVMNEDLKETVGLAHHISVEAFAILREKKNNS